MTGTTPLSPTPRVCRRARGFTLLEILVVIVIIGIIISIATVAVGVLGGDRELEQQSRRLWAVLTQGREEAELQGRDIGLFIDAESYEFMVFDQKRASWMTVEEDDLLARRELPPGIRLRLWLESREVILKPVGAMTADQLARRAPQIVMVASGEVAPFLLEMAREGGNARWQVMSQPDNTIDVEQADGS